MSAKSFLKQKDMPVVTETREKGHGIFLGTIFPILYIEIKPVAAQINLNSCITDFYQENIVE